MGVDIPPVLVGSTAFAVVRSPRLGRSVFVILPGLTPGILSTVFAVASAAFPEPLPADFAT
jgi:hypothetical protein